MQVNACAAIKMHTYGPGAGLYRCHTCTVAQLRTNASALHAASYCACAESFKLASRAVRRLCIYASRCERTKLKSARERRSTLSCTAAAASL